MYMLVYQCTYAYVYIYYKHISKMKVRNNSKVQHDVSTKHKKCVFSKCRTSLRLCGHCYVFTDKLKLF